MSALAQFLTEVPAWLLFSALFLPFTLLLLLIIAHLRWKLAEVEAELTDACHPRDTAHHLCYGTSPWKPQRMAGKRMHT
ncbi:hypothetical protein MATL_G00205060 [Megalops atlanticus]|uniref:Uncharacterized protein n=1 Tax=Megalops atlanticus TaxID=7932 RepID=A0A9D3PKC2_MEGAT|nr:hypothetical protein MATL_G00205060 [Megalops atlanticus]